MKLTVRTWPDPILLEPCSPWNFDQPPVQDIDRFEKDLVDTMLAERGLGLAANQAGFSLRVLVMHVQETDRVVIMYNPRLKHASQEQWLAPEGCLSFPGIELDIARPKYATAQWQDRSGAWQEYMFRDIDAKCFLHELDHLNGVTFKTHVSDLRFQTAARKAQKR